MKLSDFDFDLPEALIATRPRAPPVSARLLVAQPTRNADRHVHDLPDVVARGRFAGAEHHQGDPGAADGPAAAATARRGRWWRRSRSPDRTAARLRGARLAKPLRKLAEGERWSLPPGLSANVSARPEDVLCASTLTARGDFDAALETGRPDAAAALHQARRKADAQDRTDYQTVFARDAGAVYRAHGVAAFRCELLALLRARGVEFAEVTLHVGAGTFLPVKTDDVSDHKMHAEWGQVGAPPPARSPELRRKPPRNPGGHHRAARDGDRRHRPRA